MRRNNLTILNYFKLLRSRSSRQRGKLFPPAHLGPIYPYLKKATQLSLGRVDRLVERFRVCNNLLALVTKMNKHHGSEFTIRWLKCSHVALMKYLAGDPLSSLRELEPNLPLPRLINGCPAFISKRDRRLMKEGNTWVARFWLTQFSVYRILKGPMNPKLETIYGPFKGDHRVLLDLCSIIKTTKEKMFFHKLKDINHLSLEGPGWLHWSFKASPMSSPSWKGILSDFKLLTESSLDAKIDLGPRKEWTNILAYIELLRSNGIVLSDWDNMISKLSDILARVKSAGMVTYSKNTLPKSFLSQLSIKEEAAGKVRVFALIDSLSQTSLKSLHQYLFKILARIPNDGTFDQKSSVRRCAEKAERYGACWSFDLSAATDRLPRVLTGSILENLVGIPGFGDVWCSVIADREFSFLDNSQMNKKYPGLIHDQNNLYRYAVGQPMGGLSSWAGLAVTHHWILQYCSFSTDQVVRWEERYEILGDDIVIFDKELAEAYLIFMEQIGCDINTSKSLRSSSGSLEFAKNLIFKGQEVSGLSLGQVISSNTLGSRVADSVTWIKSGLIRSLPHLGMTLGGKTVESYKEIQEVGLAAIALLSALVSDETSQLRIVIDSLINPKEDFDLRKSKLDLPLRSILQYSLNVLSGEVIGKNKRLVGPCPYPFSSPEKREAESRIISVRLIEAILGEANRLVVKFEEDIDIILQNATRDILGIKRDKDPLTDLESQLVSDMKSLLLESISKSDLPRWAYVKLGIKGLLDPLAHTWRNIPSTEIFDRLSYSLEILEFVEGKILTFLALRDSSSTEYQRETSPVLRLVKRTIDNQLIIPLANDEATIFKTSPNRDGKPFRRRTGGPSAMHLWEMMVKHRESRGNFSRDRMFSY